MKNVKLNLKKATKAGFSLVEMLVVIAIIGIIAAIAIPNIGNLNTAAENAAAQRNAQNVASVWNSAVAAGTDLTGISDKASAVTAVQTGVPGSGAFASNTFSVGTLDNEADVLPLLKLESDKTLTYIKTVPVVP